MIGQPDQEGRERILEIHTQDTPLAPDVTLREIAEITDGYVGSDLEGIAREAAIEALRDDDDAEEVEMKHFRRALESVRPTINDDILAYYEGGRRAVQGRQRQRDPRHRRQDRVPITLSASSLRITFRAF